MSLIGIKSEQVKRIRTQEVYIDNILSKYVKLHDILFTDDIRYRNWGRVIESDIPYVLEEGTFTYSLIKYIEILR